MKGNDPWGLHVKKPGLKWDGFGKKLQQDKTFSGHVDLSDKFYEVSRKFGQYVV